MKAHKLLVIVGSLLLLALFFFPLWNIMIGAPQYPIPLGMDIWINKIVGVEPNDIQNIDLMNHYVGMDPIPKDMPEFHIFPIVIGVMSALGVIFGLMGKYKLYFVWLVVMSLLGVAGMYDFYLWEYEYGHNLNPHAAIQFLDDAGNKMAYQPPLFGTKYILNFDAHSYPTTGAYFMFVGMVMVGFGWLLGWKDSKN